MVARAKKKTKKAKPSKNVAGLAAIADEDRPRKDGRGGGVQGGLGKNRSACSSGGPGYGKGGSRGKGKGRRK